MKGRQWGNVSTDGKQKRIDFLITTKKPNRLLSLDWMKKLGMTQDTERTVPLINDPEEDRDNHSEKKIAKMVNKITE